MRLLYSASSLVLGLVLFAGPVEAQNFGNIPPNTVIGNPSTSVSAAPARPMPISSAQFSNFNLAAPFPSSFGPTPTNFADINIGNVPASVEIPAGVAQGLSVKVAVPSSFTENPWPSTAVSGYITNGNTSSPNSSVVALFGFAGQTTGAGTPGTPFGLNVVATNCAKLGCTVGSGFANGNAIGGELDVNVMRIGAATPIGQAVGLFLTGSSEVSPSNGSYGVRVKPLGLGVPWTIGYQTDPGAAGTAMQIGPATVSGASNSQPLAWEANNGGQIFMSAFLDQSQYLNFQGTPDSGGIVALNVQARNAFKFGAPGSGVNVLTSAGGTNTTVYGDLGTPAIVLQNTIAQNEYRNTLHMFQDITGLVNYAQFVALGGAGTTTMNLTVNNTGGGASVSAVTLGATDSGGTGFKVLRVPN